MAELKEKCLVPNGITPGSDRQLVVFTEFADTADWLVKRFKDDGYGTRRYSGRDSHGVRDEIRADFVARKFQVIVSTDAGNEGIDLQSAQVLVNWDIPWSLVRLEQRMGRIHRVGQTEKVWLYNLVATDTREGEALARLLDNLIEAANELGGKIFDSLSLVGEAALAEAGVDSLEKLLQSTYQSGNTDPALHAIRSITRERLRQIHDAQRQADDFLKSGIDVNAALTAFHDDRLERINPHIVERFLNRVASAGLLSVARAALADQGLWYLTQARSRCLRSYDQKDRAARRSWLRAAKPSATRSNAGRPARLLRSPWAQVSHRFGRWPTLFLMPCGLRCTKAPP